MDLPALLSGRCSVDSRAHQRMPEGHALPERKQPVRLRVHGGERDPESLGCSQQQQRIADRLGRRDQQQTPRVVGERLNPTNEALLDPPCEPLRLDQAEAARQLPCRQAPRELEQRQRITACLSDDPVSHPLIQLEVDRRAQQRAGIPIPHANHLQLGHVQKLLAGLARGEHDRNRLRQQATCNKRQGQRRRPIQPLRVIDHTQQRTLLGHLREQTQHRQPDEEPIRGLAASQAEHDLHGLPLRRRKPLQPVEQRPAQLMQAGEGQLHIRLDPHRPHDGRIRRRRDQVFQQRRLADPGLSPQHQRPALTAPDRRDQVIQQRAFASPDLAGVGGRPVRGNRSPPSLEIPSRPATERRLIGCAHAQFPPLEVRRLPAKADTTPHRAIGGSPADARTQEDGARSGRRKPPARLLFADGRDRVRGRLRAAARRVAGLAEQAMPNVGSIRRRHGLSTSGYSSGPIA